MILCSIKGIIFVFHFTYHREEILFFVYNFGFILIKMNLDGCDRLFSLHPFRTLPVGDILGSLLVCVIFISFRLFYSTASLPPYCGQVLVDLRDFRDFAMI